MSEYPEHEKLSAISDQSQAICDFIEWVGEKYDAHLGIEQVDGTLTYTMPLTHRISMQKVLAEFFDIDLKVIEIEKRKMLDDLREMNGAA